MLGGACMRALSNGRDGEPRLPWREGGPVCAGVSREPAGRRSIEEVALPFPPLPPGWLPLPSGATRQPLGYPLRRAWPWVCEKG